jgi:hypothetical protein
MSTHGRSLSSQKSQPYKDGAVSIAASAAVFAPWFGLFSIVCLSFHHE